jgi:hypothetical protein
MTNDEVAQPDLAICAVRENYDSLTEENTDFFILCFVGVPFRP